MFLKTLSEITFLIFNETCHNVRSCGQMVIRCLHLRELVVLYCRVVIPAQGSICILDSVLLDAGADKKRLVVIPTQVPASGMVRDDPAKSLVLLLTKKVACGNPNTSAWFWELTKCCMLELMLLLTKRSVW